MTRPGAGDKTLGILDLLDEYNIKTTFFLVDIWTQKYPELVKEIVARGHEIGNHSTSHPQMSKLNETQIAKELNTQADNVLAIAGVRPVLFRPPYGDYNNRVITTARAQGFVPIQWSVDSLDWKNRGAQEIINRATKVKAAISCCSTTIRSTSWTRCPQCLNITPKTGIASYPYRKSS